MSVVGILLAAGSSRRFGHDKLVAPWHGLPLWEHARRALMETPGIHRVLVVTRPGFAEVRPARKPCVVVENPAHEEGMGASLRAGVRAAPADAEAYVVALADMPRVGAGTVQALVDAWLDSARGIVVPVHRGRRGHPVVIGAAFRDALLACAGDVGARDVLRAHADRVLEVEVDDPGVVTDVDVPADLDD